MYGNTPSVCVDTSVFGGAFDPEFSLASKLFFQQVRLGLFDVTVPALVSDELTHASERISCLFHDLEPFLGLVEIDVAAFSLRRAYLAAGVVSPKWSADALHVAVATVAGCRAIVSWNFKHIVNFRRIPLYNGVNQSEGYGPIAIHTPQEVIFDEEE